MILFCFPFSPSQDYDRKIAVDLHTIKRQADQIQELERAYKEECQLRKKYFNMMEGEYYSLSGMGGKD